MVDDTRSPVHYHVTMVHDVHEVRIGTAADVPGTRAYTDHDKAMQEAKNRARRLADELRSAHYRVRVKRISTGYVVRWNRGYSVERVFRLVDCHRPECLQEAASR